MTTAVPDPRNQQAPAISQNRRADPCPTTQQNSRQQARKKRADLGTDACSRLSAETNAILRDLERVTSFLADARDAQDALERIGQVLSQVLQASRWSIMLKTELDVMRIVRAKGLSRSIIDQTQLQLGESVAGLVAQLGKAALFGDVEYEIGMTSGGRYISSSAICVPVILRGDVLGVINLSEKQLADGRIVDFNQTDLSIALLTANQAALMMEMLHVIEVVRGHSMQMAADPRATISRGDLIAQASAFDLLSRVTNLMTLSGNLDEVLTTAINGACALLGATRGSLMLYDQELEELRIHAHTNIPSHIVKQVHIKPGQGIAGRVLQTGEALLLSNAPRTRLGGEDNTDPQAMCYNNHSALSVPLKIRDQVLGVININDRSDQDDFSANDLYIARVIANQTAVAILAANLLKESVEAAETRRLLNLAHDIQAHFVPEVLQAQGVQIAGLSDPCASAGGDYIDYFPTCSNAGQDSAAIYCLACGDVSGHGVGSALIMAMGRAFLRALLKQESDLTLIMHRMNNLIEADTPAGQFMTLFVGILDCGKGQLTYASAGHDPALCYHPETDQMVETESTGLPLGMFKDQTYQLGSINIGPGAVLVLSTDGIPEAVNSAGLAYGRSRLKQDIRELAQHPAEPLARNIRQRVLEFAFPEVVHDDLSLIVIKLD